MAMKKLLEDLYWVGALDPELRRFDIIMETAYGTTYNAYLLKGTEKTALIETAKATRYDEFIENVTAVCSPSQIDYIIVNHTEPDHVGSAARLLEQNPDITIVGSVAAINFLKQIMNREFHSLAVKDGDSLSLGGKTLHFFSLPHLHWPDTIYTWWEEQKVLFPCDSYGAHYSHEPLLLSTVTDYDAYLSAAKYYFDNILGPFKPFMNKAIDKTEELNPSMICPGHGPVLDRDIAAFLKTYREWSRLPEKPATPLTVIAYVSAYGYTKKMAETIAQSINHSGKVTAELYDMELADPAQVLSRIAIADGLLLGSPTILGEALKPIWDLAASLFPAIHQGKCAAAFGSYGWSGEAVPHLTERLNQLRMKTVEGLRIRFNPSEEELSQTALFGTSFAEYLVENVKK